MNIATECMVLTLTNNKIMNTEDIKDFIRNRALRYAGSCSSQGSMEFNILNELYFDLCQIYNYKYQKNILICFVMIFILSIFANA